MIDTLMKAMNVAGSEWVLWLLFGLSAASVAVMLERGMFLWKRRVDLDELIKRLDVLLDAGDVDEALRLLAESPSMETQVGHRVLRNSRLTAEGMEDIYRGAVERERMRYERSVGFLATLGSNAPFIGLFGTVLGIIAAFADLTAATKGANRSQVIMGSISEALVATAVGLLVAIPAVIAYNSLQKRIDKSVGGTEVVFRSLMARTRNT